MRCERLEDRRLLSVAPVYSTNFDSGTLDPEWSPPSAYNYWEGWGNMYIQGNNSITLSLSDLDPHTDVAINYMMNGLMMERFGQSLGDPETHMGDEDVFEVSVDGDVVLRFTATFTPYLDEGFWYPDREIEYEYFNGAWFNPEGALCVPHAGSSLEIEFKASQLEPELDYEEWQLDDVAVSAYQPTVTIAAADATADEDGNTGQFTVTRDANPFRQDPYDGNLTVNLAEPTGDAEEGVDYETLPDTVTIDTGDASADPLIVTPIDDPDAEGIETIELAVAAGANYFAQATAPATRQANLDDDVSVESIDVSFLVGSNSSYGYSFNVRVKIIGEHLDQVQVRQRITASTSLTDFNGTNLTREQVLAQYPGSDPNVVDSNGAWNTDTEWDWQNVQVVADTNNGEARHTDSQLMQVPGARVVPLNGTQDTQINWLAGVSKYFRLETREVATTDVLRSFDWGYKWNNYNCFWSQANGAPEASCVASHLGRGIFYDIQGVTDLEDLN